MRSDRGGEITASLCPDQLIFIFILDIRIGDGLLLQRDLGRGYSLRRIVLDCFLLKAGFFLVFHFLFLSCQYCWAPDIGKILLFKCLFKIWHYLLFAAHHSWQPDGITFDLYIES